MRDYDAPPMGVAPPPAATSSLPAVPTAARFDGFWSGQFSCQGTGNMREYSHAFVIQVKDGRIIRRVDTVSIPAGSPGYTELHGEITAGGDATFNWSGIAVGHPGKSAILRGASYSHQIAGKFDDEKFRGRDLTALPRICEFDLTRLR